MTSGELLKKLFKSYQQRDDNSFRIAAAEIIAAEQRKNHNLLAQDLKKILTNGNGNGNNQDGHYQLNSTGLRKFENLPKDNEQGTLLLDIRSSNKFLSDIVLDDDISRQIEIVTEEFHSSAILNTYNLKPRRKILFCGPPGCGKTLGAEVLAGELGLPLLYTRFDAVISSYLGETASNLRKIFDYASRGTWIVFFDEFDAIGKSRDNVEEHGELKRVVNTFLQLLDNFQSDSLFIAATNHEGLLDNALWRRFDDIIYFNRPSAKQIFTLIDLKLKTFKHKKLQPELFISEMEGWSYSDVERVCIEAMKISVLANSNEIDNNVFSRSLDRQKHRNYLVNQTYNQ